MKIPIVTELVDEVIREQAEQRRKSRGSYEHHHNPSSASSMDAMNGNKIDGACLRQQYYKATNVPPSEPVKPKGQLNMDFGNAIHDKYAHYIKKIPGYFAMDEVPMKASVEFLKKKISLRVDGLLVPMDTGIVEGGIEIKTCKSDAISSQHWGLKKKGPKLDHLLQVITYFGTNPHLKWFSLIYLARDTSDRIEFHIVKNGDAYWWRFAGEPKNKSRKIEGTSFDHIRGRWVVLEGHLEKGFPPPRDYNVFLNKDGKVQKTKTVGGETKKSHFRCLYCDYLTYCWEKDK